MLWSLISCSVSSQKPAVTTDMSKDGGDQSPFCKCAPKPPQSRSPSSPPPPQHALLTDGVQGHQGPPTLVIISPASTKPARCFFCLPAVSPALPTSFPAPEGHLLPASSLQPAHPTVCFPSPCLLLNLMMLSPLRKVILCCFVLSLF